MKEANAQFEAIPNWRGMQSGMNLNGVIAADQKHPLFPANLQNYSPPPPPPPPSLQLLESLDVQRSDGELSLLLNQEATVQPSLPET